MLLSDLLILSIKLCVQHNKVVLLMNRIPNVVNLLVFGLEGNAIKGRAGLQCSSLPSATGWTRSQTVERVCGSSEVDGGVGVPSDGLLWEHPRAKEMNGSDHDLPMTLIRHLGPNHPRTVIRFPRNGILIKLGMIQHMLFRVFMSWQRNTVIWG